MRDLGHVLPFRETTQNLEFSTAQAIERIGCVILLGEGQFESEPAGQITLPTLDRADRLNERPWGPRSW